MRLTPIEIRQHRFNARLRGYDRDEVAVFLETVVSDYEDIVRENAQLRREAERLARDLDALRAREQSIQQTLTTAQGVVDQLKRTAMKESEQIVVDAELRAEKMLAETREARVELEHDVAEMRQLRARLDSDLRHTVKTYEKLIDGFSAGRGEARESKPDESV